MPDADPLKRVTVSTASTSVILTSEDIQLLETAIEVLLYSDIEEGEQAREMRHVGKCLHELMERLSPLLEE